MKHLIYMLFVLSINISNTHATNLQENNTIKDLQIEILNNNNIGKLEINYIYNKLLSIIERIEDQSEPENLIYLDFKFISEYIEYLLDRNINKYELEEIWTNLIDNPEKSKNYLLNGKDKILKEVKIF